MTRRTWLIWGAVRWVIGLVLGLWSLGYVANLGLSRAATVLASLIITVVATTIISYGPMTYDEYVKQKRSD